MPDQTSRHKAILLFGAPGSGKGTQGGIIGRIPGFYHFSCGDMFRNMDIYSDLGKVFYEYSSRGELVPDEVTVKMWAKAVSAHTFLGSFKPRSDLLILDGIPRTPQQAKLLEEHIDVLKVVHLTCDDEEAMFERLRHRALRSNRTDDADEKVIRHRWEVYQRDTYPVLNYYPTDKIANVNAIGSPSQILIKVLEVIEPLHESHFAQFSG